MVVVALGTWSSLFQSIIGDRDPIIWLERWCVERIVTVSRTMKSRGYFRDQLRRELSESDPS